MSDHEGNHPHRSRDLILILGVIFFIIGLYGLVRVSVNMLALEKYPTSGVYSFGFFNAAPYYEQRESDCMYPMVYYKPDNMTTREPTKEEKERDENQQKVCLEGISQSRATSKADDIAQSLLFLFLGGGVLVSRRFIK